MAIERLNQSQLDDVYRQQRLNRIPRGCDSQGRYPQAAEACTEVGVDEDDLSAARGVVYAVMLALAFWGLVAAVALW